MGDTRTKKELVDVGGKPLLWHVLSIFRGQGVDEFVLALGYHAEQVKAFFDGYNFGEKVHLIDTGLDTEKGARLGRIRPYISTPQFMVAYGEAVANIDLEALQAFHASHGKLATITGIQVNFQYGVINTDLNDNVLGFVEKPKLPYWINGGFMLFDRTVLEMIPPDCDTYNLETELLPALAKQGQLAMFKHDGYWQSMKTLKEANLLNDDWAESQPWRVW